MSIRNISWGKGGRCLGLTTLPLSCADCLEIWEPQPPGTFRACPGLQWECFTFTSCQSQFGREGDQVSTNSYIQICYMPGIALSLLPGMRGIPTVRFLDSPFYWVYIPRVWNSQIIAPFYNGICNL